MFVFVPVLRPKGFSRVQTAARFTAEDPWHPGRLAHFTVDEYAPTMVDNQALAGSTREWRWFVGFYRALNVESQPSGPRRFLPDSLVELWMTGQVPTENLPYLLHAIEPTLKKQDARPLLRDRRLKILTVVETVLCSILEICAIVGVIVAPAPPLIALAVVLGTTALLAFFLDQLCYSKIRRRRRQMHWLLAHQTESAPAPMSEAQIQARCLNQIPPLEPLIQGPFDDALFFPRDAKLRPAAPPATPPVTPPVPPPVTPNLGPAGFTFDSMLRVPEAMEPRIESRLKEEIPELQWEDLAENWGKIRIVGTTRESFQRIVVSISRKEPPGPFRLRIRVCTVLQSEAEAFYKAMIHRLWLSLLASTSSNPTVSDNLADTPHPPPFIPPFFSRESLFHIPPTLEPGMAMRIKSAIPELTWLDHAPDWEQVRIVASSNDPNRRTIVSIHRSDPAKPFELWIHTTASSPPIAYVALTSLLDRIRAACDAIPPDVTFDSQLSILEPQATMLEFTLQERIPELNWQNHAESDGPKNVNNIDITGTPPDLAPRILVSISGDAPLGTFEITIQIRIVIRGCFEVQAQTFHQAMLQRLHFSLCPATYSYVRTSEPTAIQPLTMAYSTPFTPPFFSLRTDVPVAEEFEKDNMAAFVTRLENNIAELSWAGLAEDGREVRIAASSLGLAGFLPTPNTIQRVCLSLFRRGPFGAFDLWIHVTAASWDEADRALHLLTHRVRLVLRSLYTGPYVPLPGNSMTRVLPADYPPIFHLNFRMEAPPPGLPLDMESRLNDGTPGAPWKAIVRNGTRKGVCLKTEDFHGFQLIYILAQQEPDRIRVIIDTTAASQERLVTFREYMIRKIQKALLNPLRRP